MLSRFFGERIGGVRFFDELDRLKQDPVLNYDVLELQHTCLALGFQGIHRTSAGGVSTLQQIQRDLYETLRRVKPKVIATCRRAGRVRSSVAGVARRGSVVGVARFAGLSCSGFISISLLAHRRGRRRRQQHDRLLAAQAVARAQSSGDRAAAGPRRRPNPIASRQLQRICTALAPEVAADKVAVEQTANQITIRLGNSCCSIPASADVLDQFKPIGDRIVATLDKEDGYIKVIGHTDNTPIGTAMSASRPTMHSPLSAPRAVAGLFKATLAKPDRLQTDGKGETRRSPTTTPRWPRQEPARRNREFRERTRAGERRTCRR